MEKKNNLVLCCIDGSSVSEAVCDYASWIVQKSAAPLKLLHTIEHAQHPAVSDYTGAIGLGSQEELLNELTQVEQERSRLLIKQGQLMLNAAKERITKSGVAEVETRQWHGSLAESLVELEDEIGVLVLGIRGETHEQTKQGIGHQLESVIRALHKPILVVNTAFSEPKKVMLAYDGSDACKKALAMVASSNLIKNIPCHVVHVGDNGQALLDHAVGALTEAGVETVAVQLQGNIEEVLSQYQSENQIDLTVMGAFSHSRFRGFLLGSFTEKMLAKTNRPLLLLR